MSKNYLLNKISTLNYHMATHEGNANARLAYFCNEIILIGCSKTFIPEEYQKEFYKFLEKVEHTAELAEGRRPLRIQGIYNATATKYIKLLWNIEEKMKDN